MNKSQELIKLVEALDRKIKDLLTKNLSSFKWRLKDSDVELEVVNPVFDKYGNDNKKLYKEMLKFAKSINNKKDWPLDDR